MRVMRVLTRPNVGGPTIQAAALFHAHRDLGVTTLLCVGSRAVGETPFDLSAAGIPLFDPAQPQLGGHVVVEGLGRRWTPWSGHRAERHLEQLVAAFAPEVVHTHTSVAGWLGRRVAVRRGVPVVAHTYHGIVLRDYFGPLRQWLLRRLERRWAARSDLLFAVSESCRRELAELGVAALERIRPIPVAVPLAADTPMAPVAVAKQQAGAAVSPSFAFVGRLVAVKRPEHFLQAVHEIGQARGVVYGEGPLRPRLQAHPGAERIRFQPHAEPIGRVLQQHDALVLTSVREGYPLVAVEAFAAGVPVIGYEVPGVADVLGGGRGILVPPAEGPAGLACAMRHIVADADLRARVVAQARASLACHRPVAVAAELLAAYREAGGRG
jgi:glycosyltransferase involved in cell wall biosynthesis